MTDLFSLLMQQFPSAQIDPGNDQIGLGDIPEWDSLGHFNFLLLVEQTYGVRFEPDELTNMKRLADIRSALSVRGISL